MNIEQLQLALTVVGAMVVGFIGGVWITRKWSHKERARLDEQIRQHKAWRQQAEQQVQKEGVHVKDLREAVDELEVAILSKDEKKAGEALPRVRQLVGYVADANELLVKAVQASAP